MCNNYSFSLWHPGFKRQLPILKQHFKTEGRKGLWVNDAGKVSPYTFLCPNCQNNTITIELQTQPSFNCTYLEVKQPPIKLTALRAWNSGSLFYQLIKCAKCPTVYFAGFTYTEPNYGRDVFLLKTILEVDCDYELL